MKKIFCISMLLIATWSCAPQEKESPRMRAQGYLLEQADSLTIALTILREAVEKNEPPTSLQEKFEKARMFYKHVEPLTELYFPGFSEAINGPAIDEEEMYEGGKVTEATGFQVVEELIYTGSTEHSELLRETSSLASMTNRLKQLVTGNELTDEHVFQAVRLELLRVASLGLSGFDSPIALQSLVEARHALKGVEHLLSLYESDHALAQNLRDQFHACYKFLGSQSNFDTFDRATFLTDYLTPLSKSIFEFQKALHIKNRRFLSAVNLDNFNFFDSGTYQLSYFANTTNRKVTPEMIELGRLLFFDPILSGNNKRACASCHNPSKGFTDGRVKSLAFEANGTLMRNAPTVINSGYQRMQFYDSRIMFHEDQVTDVMKNPAEMHGDVAEAVAKLQTSSEYRALFKKSYGDKGDNITNRYVQMALASYIRSLSSLNSNFDLYMRGDKSKMSTEAIAGFNIFMGKAKCGTCHFMPLFNGTVPPMFAKSESEVLGVPQKPDTTNATLDTDPGKYGVFGGELNKHAFKTPSIRNVALTAPYMHNGIYNTLEEVIDFYNRGGGAGIGIEIPNQTLPPDKLNLTEQEKKNIVSFIQNLTDTTGLTSIPRQLPRFDDPVLNRRKIGGEY